MSSPSSRSNHADRAARSAYIDRRVREQLIQECGLPEAQANQLADLARQRGLELRAARESCSAQTADGSGQLPESSH